MVFQDSPSTGLPPGTLISHYRIIEKIGAGGMGVVYKAEDTKLKRHVALKLLGPALTRDREAKERFLREAQAASAPDHPNICTIHEIDETEDGRMFISMSCYEGMTLGQRMAEGPFGLEEVLDIAIQVAQGLREAHKNSIVHRDIKPENIMITTDGQVKIMDFGLAKLRGVSNLTRVGTALGTWRYMSPEQAQGMELDQRTDIFSLGVVLYQMIAGRLPFTGDYEQAVVHSIINDTAEPLATYKAEVPEGLQRIMDKVLAKDREERYQDADELLADLRREKIFLESGELAQVSTPAVPAMSNKRLLRSLIPVAGIAVGVVLLLVLGPFRVGMGPREEAAARENYLAIMYFENLADREDPDKLGEIVTNLLITDLSESRYMSVVSSQRLYDILKLLGREGIKVVDRNVASEVASRADARWMLLGSILQVEPHVILTSQLVEAETGKVVASQRIAGEIGEDVFSLVDRLTVDIKKDLSLPAAAQAEPDRPVADVTTHSPEAYRDYLEGLEHLNKYYLPDAKRSFNRALESDSSFAMAYSSLAYTKWLRGEGDSQGRRELIAKAFKYSDKVPRKERHYIAAQAAHLSRDYAGAVEELEQLLDRYPDDKAAHDMLGMIYHANLRKFEKAIYHLSRAVEIDPFLKTAYNMLAYSYHRVGDFDKSIWAINKYISLAPDEANPYDSRGDLYAYAGQVDLAIESYKKALEIKPDFSISLRKLGDMYLYSKAYAKAESIYQRVCLDADKHIRSRGRTKLALVLVYRGKFDDALEVLDDGIAADRMERAESMPKALKHIWAGSIYREKGNLAMALKEVEEGTKIWQQGSLSHRYYWAYLYPELLAEKGETASAEEHVATLRKNIEQTDTTQMFYYWLALGNIERIKGDSQRAVTHLEKASLEAASPDLFHVRLYLARAYLEAGRLGEAVGLFEKVLSRYDTARLFSPVLSVKGYYLLGLAYEKSGWSNKAIEQYGEFLDIWKDADPGIPEIEDAHRRLARLRQVS
jgi:tetratricopeptide (TPR) repeat protein/tRNA A-37 threonylcarbamoyl transferase component Bud32